MAREEGDATPLSRGVDDLIARLREEGVTAGRAEAERIVADARAEAKRTLEQAAAEARSHLEASRKEADAYRTAGEAALRTAMRDTVLDLKARLMQQFSADVGRLVTHKATDPKLLERMIVEVAGRAREGAGLDPDEPLEVVLPAAVVGLDELRNDPDELEKGELTTFVLGLTGEMLRSGVTLSASDEVAAGLVVRVSDKDITLDLTDKAVAALILQHLQPRFRAVLEGIVK